MRRPHLGERTSNGFDATGVALFPLTQHFGYKFSLQILLRAAQIAGNDREALLLGICGEVFLGDIGKRPDDNMLSVIGAQLRRHRLHLPAVEKVEEESGEDVIAMMAERELG